MARKPATYIPDHREPVWDAWVKHVEYFKMLGAEEFSEEDIVKVDQAVYAAQEAFKKAFGGQKLVKPKSHFSSHAAVNILKSGPMREYWCYSYEGMHQRVKRIANGSNWRNVSKRIMRFWCNQFMCLIGLSQNEQRRLNNLA